MPVLVKPAVQQQITGVIRYKSKPRPLYRVTLAYLRKIQRSPLLKQALKLAMSLHLNLNETSQTLTISQKF